MTEETTTATPEYLAARQERMASVHDEVYRGTPAAPPTSTAEATVTLPLGLWEEVQSILRDVRTNNALVMTTMELQIKEVRFLAWCNVELKQRLAALEGKKEDKHDGTDRANPQT